MNEHMKVLEALSLCDSGSIETYKFGNERTDTPDYKRNSLYNSLTILFFVD